MILPTTYIAALLLLVLSSVCLGSWIHTFKLAGTRWRFELFYIDFAVGAILFSVIAAFTFGSLGSDLAFTDRMLVAGRGAQVFVIAAGAVFNLGNMLLVAAVSLIGMAGAFPFSVGLALIIASFFQFRHGNVWLLIPGIALMLIAVMLDITACRMRNRMASKAPAHREPASTPSDAAASGQAAREPVNRASVKTASPSAMMRPTRKGAPSPTGRSKARRTTKGFIVATISGISLGVVYPIAARGMTGDFGLGPYAGLLMLSIGVLLATITLNFYFLNIAIDGEPLKFGAYFRGNARQHFLGFGGGALWAAGTLMAFSGNMVKGPGIIGGAVGWILPFASVLVAMFWGVISWKEFATAPAQAKTSLALTAALFLCGTILLGIGFSH